MRTLFDLTEIGHRAFQRIGEMLELEHGLDARQELEPVDRFADEIIRPRVDPAFDVAELVQSGDHDDRDILGVGIVLESPADLESTHLVLHNVQKHQVRLSGVNDLQSLNAIMSGDRLALEILQIGLDQLKVLLVIIHHQDDRQFLTL